MTYLSICLSEVRAIYYRWGLSAEEVLDTAVTSPKAWSHLILPFIFYIGKTHGNAKQFFFSRVNKPVLPGPYLYVGLITRTVFQLVHHCCPRYTWIGHVTCDTISFDRYP